MKDRSNLDFSTLKVCFCSPKQVKQVAAFAKLSRTLETSSESTRLVGNSGFLWLHLEKVPVLPIPYSPVAEVTPDGWHRGSRQLSWQLPPLCPAPEVE